MMNYKAEKIVPYANSDQPKNKQVEHMFDAIALQYDGLNHLLSWNFDKNWRKKGVLSLQSIAPKQILDVATGTGDLSLEAYRRLQVDHIVGIDLSEGMMEIARKKAAQLGLSDKICFERQDCSSLSFPDQTFDAVMVAFGIRNFADLDASLKEMLRVLRPGGKLMILELSTPEYFPMKQLYRLYSACMIPLFGRFMAKNKTAYRYLPASVRIFPQNEEMVAILQKNGYHGISFKKFTFGICSMYIANKQ